MPQEVPPPKKPDTLSKSDATELRRRIEEMSRNGEKIPESPDNTLTLEKTKETLKIINRYASIEAVEVPGKATQGIEDLEALMSFLRSLPKKERPSNVMKAVGEASNLLQDVREEHGLARVNKSEIFLQKIDFIKKWLERRINTASEKRPEAPRSAEGERKAVELFQDLPEEKRVAAEKAGVRFYKKKGSAYLQRANEEGNKITVPVSNEKFPELFSRLEKAAPEQIDSVVEEFLRELDAKKERQGSEAGGETEEQENDPEKNREKARELLKRMSKLKNTYPDIEYLTNLIGFGFWRLQMALEKIVREGKSKDITFVDPRHLQPPPQMEEIFRPHPKTPEFPQEVLSYIEKILSLTERNAQRMEELLGRRADQDDYKDYYYRGVLRQQRSDSHVVVKEGQTETGPEAAFHPLPEMPLEREAGPWDVTPDRIIRARELLDRIEVLGKEYPSFLNAQPDVLPSSVSRLRRHALLYYATEGRLSVDNPKFQQEITNADAYFNAIERGLNEIEIEQAEKGSVTETGAEQQGETQERWAEELKIRSNNLLEKLRTVNAEHPWQEQDQKIRAGSSFSWSSLLDILPKVAEGHWEALLEDTSLAWRGTPGEAAINLAKAEKTPGAINELLDAIETDIDLRRRNLEVSGEKESEPLPLPGLPFSGREKYGSQEREKASELRSFLKEMIDRFGGERVFGAGIRIATLRGVLDDIDDDAPLSVPPSPIFSEWPEEVLPLPGHMRDVENTLINIENVLHFLSDKLGREEGDGSAETYETPDPEVGKKEGLNKIELSQKELKDLLEEALSGLPDLQITSLEASGEGDVIKINVDITHPKAKFSLKGDLVTEGGKVKLKEDYEIGGVGMFIQSRVRSGLRPHLPNISTLISETLGRQHDRTVESLQIQDGNLIVNFTPAKKTVEAAAPETGQTGEGWSEKEITTWKTQAGAILETLEQSPPYGSFPQERLKEKLRFLSEDGDVDKFLDTKAFPYFYEGHLRDLENSASKERTAESLIALLKAFQEEVLRQQEVSANEGKPAIPLPLSEEELDERLRRSAPKHGEGAPDAANTATDAVWADHFLETPQRTGSEQQEAQDKIQLDAQTICEMMVREFGWSWLKKVEITPYQRRLQVQLLSSRFGRKISLTGDIENTDSGIEFSNIEGSSEKAVALAQENLSEFPAKVKHLLEVKYKKPVQSLRVENWCLVATFESAPEAAGPDEARQLRVDSQDSDEEGKEGAEEEGKTEKNREEKIEEALEHMDLDKVRELYLRARILRGNVWRGEVMYKRKIEVGGYDLYLAGNRGADELEMIESVYRRKLVETLRAKNIPEDQIEGKLVEHLEQDQDGRNAFFENMNAGKLSDFKKWWRKHSMKRLGLGLGATATGIGLKAAGVGVALSPVVAFPLFLLRGGLGYAGGYASAETAAARWGHFFGKGLDISQRGETERLVKELKGELKTLQNTAKTDEEKSKKTTAKETLKNKIKSLGPEVIHKEAARLHVMQGERITSIENASIFGAKASRVIRELMEQHRQLLAEEIVAKMPKSTQAEQFAQAFEESLSNELKAHHRLSHELGYEERHKKIVRKAYASVAGAGIAFTVGSKYLDKFLTGEVAPEVVISDVPSSDESVIESQEPEPPSDTKKPELVPEKNEAGAPGPVEQSAGSKPDAGTEQITKPDDAPSKKPEVGEHREGTTSDTKPDAENTEAQPKPADAPSPSIEDVDKGEGLWETTKDMVRSGKITEAQWQEAWKNTYIDIEGKATHISEVDLVHTNDKLSFVPAGGDTPARFEFIDNPEDTLKPGTDLPWEKTTEVPEGSPAVESGIDSPSVEVSAETTEHELELRQAIEKTRIYHETYTQIQDKNPYIFKTWSFYRKFPAADVLAGKFDGLTPEGRAFTTLKKSLLRLSEESGTAPIKTLLYTENLGEWLNRASEAVAEGRVNRATLRPDR